MAFLYFVPYTPTWNMAAIQKMADLPPLAREAMMYLNDVDGGMPECRSGPGPKQENGLLLVWQGPTPTRVEYVPAEQEWIEVRDKGPEIKDADGKVTGREPGPTIYWIGWWKNQKPGPDDLAKKNQFAGHEVAMGDGNEWLIPIVGPVFSRLPHAFEIKDGGEVESVIVKRFQGIFDRSKEFYGYCFMQSSVSRETIFEYLTDVLSLNYRVGRYEASAMILNLIDTSNYRPAVYVSVGTREIQEMEEAAKKNAAPQ